MVKSADAPQAGHAGPAPRGGRPALRAVSVFTVALGLAVGCARDKQATYDPLMGGPPPAPKPVGQASVAPPAAGAAVPPLPAPSVPGTNAALAQNNPPPLDGGTPLRIDNPPADGRTWTGQPTGNPAPAGRVAATPAVDGPPRPDPVAAAAYALPTAPGTFEDLQRQLQARAVTWQRLEMTGENAWKFSCSVPNPQNRLLSRTYEATARDPVAAMRAALDQIGREQ